MLGSHSAYSLPMLDVDSILQIDVVLPEGKILGCYMEVKCGVEMTLTCRGFIAINVL